MTTSPPRPGQERKMARTRLGGEATPLLPQPRTGRGHDHVGTGDLEEDSTFQYL